MRDELTKRTGKFYKVSLSLIFLFLIFFVPLISAAPPFQSSSIDRGITIQYPKFETINQGKDFTFHFHLFNSSDETELTPANNVNCIFHLYNNSGDHLFVNYPLTHSTGDGIDNEWEVFVQGSNFSDSGSYAYMVQCNSTTPVYQGGFVSIGFEVESEGDTELFLIIGLASLSILVIAILLQNEYIGFIAGILFIVTGIYVMIYGVTGLSNMYTRAIAFVLIGLGLIFEIAAGYKAASSGGGAVDF